MRTTVFDYKSRPGIDPSIQACLRVPGPPASTFGGSRVKGNKDNHPYLDVEYGGLNDLSS